MDTSATIDTVLRTHKIPYVWPQSVKEQIKKLKEEVLEESKIGRVDLRNLPLITIDGEDANDFDDAVYCEKEQGGGRRLWVAISDVSYYVHPYTPLDKEARNRGTSVYFPSRVIPMLPEVLSNRLCSLNPKVDRLCITCEMTISDKGDLTSYKFYEAVINSHARLTYTKVWNMLQGDQKLRKQYASLVNNIEELYDLYKTLHRAHKERGRISFENEAVKFILNTEQHIERIEQIRRNDAHRLIEECMILANISAARFLEKEKEPILFRIHEKPSIGSITAFRSVLSALGLKLPSGNRFKTHDYAKLVRSIANHPNYEMLQTILLRSMKKAIYSPNNLGHFGLAVRSYAHFTSPIRRYPDLHLHRAIKHVLVLKQNRDLEDTVIGKKWNFSTEEVLQLGQHCSMTERRAEEAIRKVADWLKCNFMTDRIGYIFKGMISSVTEFGFFVRLDELFIDGLVHISNLDNDYYYFDEVGHRLIGKSSGRSYRIGDHVRVRVVSININECKINLSIIYNETNHLKIKKSLSKIKIIANNSNGDSNSNSGTIIKIKQTK